ncbi:MAG: hypothetical protein K2L45_12320 [Muribaculaceae bacterium]|nr:hypothetical protein [Muribaculaceae bacterium]
MNTESIPQDRFSSFIGSAVAIKAMPMSAKHAKNAGATNVPDKYFEVGHAAYDPGAEGYLIEFFSGYRSWTPKSEFEAVYKLSETKVDRMKIELADLVERIKKVNDELYDVREHERTEDRCLCSQLRSMQGYADMLYSRIVAAVEGGVNNGTVV